MLLGLQRSWGSASFLALVSFGVVCNAFTPSTFAPLHSSAIRLARKCSFMERAAVAKMSRTLRTTARAAVMQGDDLESMFSGTEQLKFDMTWSDTENIKFDGNRATKVTDSMPAYAIFGNDSTSGIQRFGVKVLKKVHAMHVGVLVNPRLPSKPCWADTLRTPAVMIGKGGSVYRTGRLGTKMVEYLGPDLKRMMGKNYPPKFEQGDVVNIELNKDKQEVKMWINDNGSFTIPRIDKEAKFFVNMEGQDSAFELVRVN